MHFTSIFLEYANTFWKFARTNSFRKYKWKVVIYLSNYNSSKSFFLTLKMAFDPWRSWSSLEYSFLQHKDYKNILLCVLICTFLYKGAGQKYGRAKNLFCLIQLDSVERAICTKVFRTKYLKKTLQNIYMLFSQVFSGRWFTWALLYLRAVGWQNTDRNWICSTKQTKNVRFCSFQNILPTVISYHRQRDI